MTKRVLVIEDNDFARFTMREILEYSGWNFEIAEAMSGDQGIAMHKEQPFDLVITDIVMPKKDGLDTIRELKAEFFSLPIIAVSGGGRTRDMELLEAAQLLGADRTLTKPFTAKQLLESVAVLLALPPSAG